MKLAVVLYAADYTGARKHAVLKAGRAAADARGDAAGVLAAAARAGLRRLVVIAVIAFAILFLGGIGRPAFRRAAGAGGRGFALLVLIAPYRMQRIFGFMDPWSDPFGKGYQLSHALIAFGRGEWLGVGLGASVEKLHYLPEAHTDFLLR